MTQELDKNGKPKIYCANCGTRMNHTYTHQWYGSSGYRYWSYWELKQVNRIYYTREDAEVELQRLNALEYRYRGWHSNQDKELQIREIGGYGRDAIEYVVEYSEPVGEPIPYQFHSKDCMHTFLQRPDIMAQILPIITANRAKPIIPVKKPRKKRESWNSLPDYNDMNERMSDMNEKMNSMQKRILGLI